jgi:hypothetical protein
MEPGARLKEIPGSSIDRVAAAAGDDAQARRMENLDMEVPRAAAEATRAAVDGWRGKVAAWHLRFASSNEPVERLRALGDRVRAPLG